MRESRAVEPAATQICNGLGAGNIGDDLMARAFWAALPSDLRLEVEIFPNDRLQRDPYPSRHRYLRLDWDGAPRRCVASRPGLLVGDTPITESLGVDWPLRFLGPRIESFHRAGLPVDALGVGVEPLRSDEARALFRRHYLPIRSWTVRTPACREVLLDLGVPESRIVVGADWAWLFRPRRDLRAWGAETWESLGIDPSRPLLVANVINEIWRARTETRRAVAAALDLLASENDLQIAFFCQEMRPGEFYDMAASRETASLMRHPPVIVPNLYYSPDEVLGLLAHATVTLACRYHFVVASVLAGVVPACIVRSEKMEGLVRDLGLQAVARIEDASKESLCDGVGHALADGQALRSRLSDAHRGLAARARANLRLWARHRAGAASRATRP